jgi:DNA topoisomerase III
MYRGPRQGPKDDKAHPPIHPVKNASRDSMTDPEWKIYDLISRHFLATMAKDAIGSETKI